MPSQPHPILREVTARIRARSHDSRGAYLERIDKARKDGVRRGDLPCSNLAHAMAACSPGDKALMQGEVKVNLGIVTAYNDMLSAHQPYEDYPARIKAFAAEMGGVAQVAGRCLPWYLR